MYVCKDLQSLVQCLYWKRTNNPIDFKTQNNLKNTLNGKALSDIISKAFNLKEIW